MPEPQKFYLDDLARALDGTSSRLEQRIPGYVWISAGIGGLLILLSVYALVTEGSDAGLYVYTNAVLGVALIVTALRREKPGSRFASPFLEVSESGLTLARDGQTERFAWPDVEAIRTTPSGFEIRPRTGASVAIGFSALPYTQVQRMKKALAEAAAQHGVACSE